MHSSMFNDLPSGGKIIGCFITFLVGMFVLGVGTGLLIGYIAR